MIAQRIAEPGGGGCLPPARNLGDRPEVRLPGEQGTRDAGVVQPVGLSQETLLDRIPGVFSSIRASREFRHQPVHHQRAGFARFQEPEGREPGQSVFGLEASLRL